MIVSRVDDRFVLSATIWELHVGGQRVDTTSEHPFFVDGVGWVPARELKPGDRLLGTDEQFTPVESISETIRHETVYNLRVTNEHTYFVGDSHWGFSLWVHNTYSLEDLGDGTWRVLDEAGNPQGRIVKEGDEYVQYRGDDVIGRYDSLSGAQEAAGNGFPGTSLAPKGVPSPLRFGNNAKGHLVKHRDALGYGDLTAQEAQRVVPGLKAAAENLLRRADPKLTRVGQFHQHQNAMFYISDGRMVITEADGTFINVVETTSSNWYQQAVGL